MPGFISNGVYVYAEDDDAAPDNGFSDLLNKQSTALRTRFGGRDIHAEYSVAAANIANAAITNAGIPVLVGARSNPDRALFFTPQAGGLRLIKPGRYMIALSYMISAAHPNRTFADLSLSGGGNVRIPMPPNEDNSSGVFTPVTVTANENLLIQFYQLSGSAKNFTGTLRTTYLGPL